MKSRKYARRIISIVLLVFAMVIVSITIIPENIVRTNATPVEEGIQQQSRNIDLTRYILCEAALAENKASLHIPKLVDGVTATCIEEGYTGNIVCSKCGKLLLSGLSIAKTEHVAILSGDAPSTCVSEGYSGDEICADCGTVIERGIRISLIAHTEMLVGVKEATCEEDGYTGDYICFKCGTTLIKGEVIPAFGHTTHIENQKDASCSECGYTGDEVCETCGKVIIEGSEIEKLEHSLVTVGAKAATCTVKGSTGTTKCTVCGEIISSASDIPALNHKNTVIKNKKAATVDTEGYSGDKYCADCGILISKGSVVPRIISNDDKKGTYDWEYTHNAEYPLTYHDDTVDIKIDKVWHDLSWVYVCQVQLTDYTRFYTYCANGKWGSTSSTSKAAKQTNAILATNGCYSKPGLNEHVVRRGTILSGASTPCNVPAVYSWYTGLFSSPAKAGASKISTTDAVNQGLVTDTFCFGPALPIGNTPSVFSATARSQLTFLGSDGTPGKIIWCVSEGRKVDGVSSGLTFKGAAEVLEHYGCTFGVPLDGGGSSTLVFQGRILNHVSPERNWLVDFVILQ